MVTGAGVLTGANSLVQALRLIGTLAVLSIYDEQGFGLYAVFFSHVNILITINSLGYPAAIPNMKGEDVGRMAAGSLLVTAILTLNIVAAYWLSGYPFYLSLALYTFAYSSFRVFEMLYLREQSFGVMALLKPVQPLVFLSLLTLIFLYGDRTVSELISAQTASMVAAAVVFFLIGRSKIVLGDTSLKGLLNLLWRENEWPKLMAPSELLSNLGFFLPLLMIESIVGAAAAGEYGLVLRLCLGPIMVLGHSVMQVAHARFSSVRRELLHVEGVGNRRQSRNISGREKSTWVRSGVGLVMLAVVVGLGIGVVLPAVVAYLYPGKYLHAGLYARLLAPYFALLIVAMPLETAFLAFSKLQAILVFQLINLGGVVICFGPVVKEYGLTPAVATFSILGCARLAVEIMYARKVVRDWSAPDNGEPNQVG